MHDCTPPTRTPTAERAACASKLDSGNPGRSGRFRRIRPALTSTSNCVPAQFNPQIPLLILPGSGMRCVNRRAMYLTHALIFGRCSIECFGSFGGSSWVKGKDRSVPIIISLRGAYLMECTYLLFVLAVERQPENNRKCEWVLCAQFLWGPPNLLSTLRKRSSYLDCAHFFGIRKFL